MRGVIGGIAVLALAVPMPALAEACPATVGPQFAKSLGDVRAWLNDDEAVYRPSGVRKLGVPVSYVIVDSVLRWNGKGYDNAGVGRLRYRLENVARPASGPYPDGVRKDFDQSYPGSQCAAGTAEDCAAAGPFQASAGALVAAGLGEGDLYLRDSAYGPALDLVKADYDMEGRAPAFLVCEYRVEE